MIMASPYVPVVSRRDLNTGRGAVHACATARGECAGHQGERWDGLAG
jgi:hypothetical protein